MKRFIIAGLLVASTALTPVYAARNRIPISDDQRAKIVAYVSQQKLTPATLPGKTKRGNKIDSSVALINVPSEWGAELAKYKFVYTNNRVLFVNPESRVVVDAIKAAK